MIMTPLDYGRSFLTGRIPRNEVRFWVESRTRVIDERSGACEDYLQCASCKSEDTFAESNLFYADNYDFLPVFGPARGVIFRRKAWLNPNYRSCPDTRDMWGGQIHHLVEADAEELPTPDAVLAATYAFRPLVAQTEFRDADARLRAILEYPVKTMNTNRERHLYQVDTGPVALPDLARWREVSVEALGLAFIAFNVPHFADVVLEVPTTLPPAVDGVGPPAQVHHYSRRLTLATQNRLYAVGRDAAGLGAGAGRAAER